MWALKSRTNLCLAMAWTMPSVFEISPISVSCPPIIRSRHVWSEYLMTTKAEAVEVENDNGFFDTVIFSQQTLSSSQTLAAVFDHPLLKPDATRDQVIRLCEEAAQYGFACAMVNPTW